MIWSRMALSKTIHITLKYGADKNEKIITGIKRISKPGLRVYAGKENMPKVLGGLGIAIVSTNQGVITDKQARKLQCRRRSSCIRLVVECTVPSFPASLRVILRQIQLTENRGGTRPSPKI